MHKGFIMTPTETVETFIEAWNQMDWDKVVGLLDEAVVYHNIPMEKLEGRAAAESFIRGMQANAVDWITLNIAASGNIVLTERIDNFDMKSGNKVSVPVMGTFEIKDGKIIAWRDYFDLNTFVSQMS
jgi:limonene-1,2-epoxide hydrolase